MEPQTKVVQAALQQGKDISPLLWSTPMLPTPPAMALPVRVFPEICKTQKAFSDSGSCNPGAAMLSSRHRCHCTEDTQCDANMCSCLQTCAPLAWLSAVMPSNWLEEAVLLVMALPLQSFCAMPTIMLLEACMIRRSMCSSMSLSCALCYAFVDSTNRCSLVLGMLCKV